MFIASILLCYAVITGQPATAAPPQACAVLASALGGLHNRIDEESASKRFEYFKSYLHDKHFKSESEFKDFAEKDGFSASLIYSTLSLNFEKNGSVIDKTKNWKDWYDELVNSQTSVFLDDSSRRQVVDEFSIEASKIITTCLSDTYGFYVFDDPIDPKDPNTLTAHLGYRPTENTVHETRVSRVTVTPRSLWASCMLPAGQTIVNNDVVNFLLGVGGDHVTCTRPDPYTSATITISASAAGNGQNYIKFPAFGKPIANLRLSKHKMIAGDTLKILWDVSDAKSVSFESDSESGSVKAKDEREEALSKVGVHKFTIKMTDFKDQQHESVVSVDVTAAPTPAPVAAKAPTVANVKYYMSFRSPPDYTGRIDFVIEGLGTGQLFLSDFLHRCGDSELNACVLQNQYDSPTLARLQSAKVFLTGQDHDYDVNACFRLGMSDGSVAWWAIKGVNLHTGKPEPYPWFHERSYHSLQDNKCS